MAVGLAPLVYDGGAISTTATVEMRLEAVDAETSPFAGGIVPLPNLGEPREGGLSVVLPLRLSHATLDAAVESALPVTETFESAVDGSIAVRGARFASDEERLIATLDVDLSFDGLPDYSGPLTITGRPAWDPMTKTLALEDPELHGEGLGGLAMRGALALEPVRTWLADLLRVPLGPEMNDARAALDGALNRELAPGVRLLAALDVEAGAPVIDAGGIALALRAVGRMEVRGFALAGTGP
jgi:hypothetical protein